MEEVLMDKLACIDCWVIAEHKKKLMDLENKMLTFELYSIEKHEKLLKLLDIEKEKIQKMLEEGENE